MRKEAYTDNLDMNQFTHIKSISVYNKNYYNGLGTDLLFGDSNDDDDITHWYLVEFNEFVYLGVSFTSQGNVLHLNQDDF